MFLPSLEEGLLPVSQALGNGNEAALAEERRLLYVAMTRAKDELDIIVPHRFYVHQQPGRGDRHLYAARSRFLPPGILAHFEAVAWPAASHAASAARAAAPAVDLAARLRGRWQRTGT